jgi:hypothetical protein
MHTLVAGFGDMNLNENQARVVQSLEQRQMNDEGILAAFLWHVVNRANRAAGMNIEADDALALVRAGMQDEEHVSITPDPNTSPSMEEDIHTERMRQRRMCGSYIERREQQERAAALLHLNNNNTSNYNNIGDEGATAREKKKRDSPKAQTTSTKKAQQSKDKKEEEETEEVWNYWRTLAMQFFEKRSLSLFTRNASLYTHPLCFLSLASNRRITE